MLLTHWDIHYSTDHAPSRDRGWRYQRRLRQKVNVPKHLITAACVLPATRSTVAYS